jgi:hypothetical protein
VGASLFPPTIPGEDRVGATSFANVAGLGTVAGGTSSWRVDEMAEVASYSSEGAPVDDAAGRLVDDDTLAIERGSSNGSLA